jgi:hypothetical protein
MLHVLDGASSAGTLAKTDVPGKIFAWREALISGPTPAGLNEDEWIAVRSEYLSEHYGIDLEKCKSDLEEQSQTLASYSDHDEVVLWFEHDLFCQTNLLYLLNWFSLRELGSTKLSLICIGEFPGIEDFRGLGQLNPKQLASLLEQRHEVSATELELGQEAWNAYCSPDPSLLMELLKKDLSALPFLKRALESHLTRFPSVLNGLGRIENAGLRLIATGYEKFGELFPRFAYEQRVYGLGDFQLWLDLRSLSNVRRPLLQIANGANAGKGPVSEEVVQTRFELTTDGQLVLQNNEDFVELNGIDLWLGGVHLSADHDLWRWDNDKGELLHQS